MAAESLNEIGLVWADTDTPGFTRRRAGNPGKVVRMRFSDAEILTLNQIAWWDWEPERIFAATSLIEAGDVTALARA